jgi:predicted DNA-binding helix-hairpin-helix protein
VRSVNRILDARRFRAIRLADLKKLRLSIAKVRPFVIVADHNPEALRIDRSDLRQRVVTSSKQLELFTAAATARTGEL